MEKNPISSSSYSGDGCNRSRGHQNRVTAAVDDGLYRHAKRRTIKMCTIRAYDMMRSLATQPEPVVEQRTLNQCYPTLPSDRALPL